MISIGEGLMRQISVNLQKENLQKIEKIAKVIGQLADNPYEEALISAFLKHSNRWGTTSWL